MKIIILITFTLFSQSIAYSTEASLDSYGQVLYKAYLLIGTEKDIGQEDITLVTKTTDKQQRLKLGNEAVR